MDDVVEYANVPSLFVESQNKISKKKSKQNNQEKSEQPESLSSDECKQSTTQDKILQQLEDTVKNVSYFHNIISFDSDLEQSFPKCSELETKSLLMDLKKTTAAAEDAARTAQSDDATFSTSLSEEELEKARLLWERKRVEQETMLWRDNPNKSRLKIEEVIEEKVNEHYNRGVKHSNEGGFEAAVTCFKKALNLHPSDASCYVERGEAFLQLCDFRSAYLNYKKVLILQPGNPRALGRLAFICYLQGQCLFDQALYREALECFARAIDLRPNAKGYHMRAITCLAALGRNQECLALVTRRLDMEATGNPELYILRARLHQQFGNATLSYYDVRDALSLDPDLPQARDMMEEIRRKAGVAKQQALEHTIQGRLNDALGKIATAVQTDPSMADYHVLRGAIYRRMKIFNSAIDDYLLGMDKADHDESDPVYRAAQRQLLLTYNDFAVHCYNKGFFEEAIILLNKAIKGEWGEKGLYVNRGDCFFKLNELGFALADYQQALELDPGCWGIRCRLSIVQNEFGISAYQGRFYEEAAEYFSLAIQHNNKIGQFYIHRARAMYMMEEVQGARNDILIALHLDPDNDEVIPLLSRLFPGQSVSEVLQSRAAEELRSQLASTITPLTKLPSASRRSSCSSSSSKKNWRCSTLPIISDVSVVSETGGSEDEIVSLSPSAPTMRRLPSNLEILQDKKKITQDLKEIFNIPLNLNSNHPKLHSISLSELRNRRATPSTNKWRRVGSIL